MPNSRPEATAREGFNPRLFLRLYLYTGPYAAKRNLVLLTSFIRAFQRPLLFWAVAAIIKGPITAGHYRATLLWTLGYFALVLSTSFLLHLRSRHQNQLGELLVHDLRNALFQNLQRQTLRYYHQTKLGRIISRMVSDLESIRQGVQLLVFIAQEFVQLAFCGALMFYYSWILFLIILAFSPFLLWINHYFRPRIQAFSRIVAESSSRLTGTLAESVRGIRVIQGFSRQPRGAELFAQGVQQVAQDNVNLSSVSNFYAPLLGLTGQCFLATLLIVVGYGSFHDLSGLKLDSLVAFFFLPTSFFMSVQAAATYYPGILASQAGAERVFAALDQKPEWSDDPHAQELPDPRSRRLIDRGARVEFRQVSFSYELGRPVLHHLSFVAQAGQTVALVGHTGSGKTTIINLIGKFYLPDSGEILIDGCEIRQLQSHSLHRQIGLVLQTNFLFTGSVLDNIRFGHPEATPDAVREAARQLACEDLLESLPQGFCTQVGEGGTSISLGQRQLICFTRAFLANPRILILDEATSSIDTITEARLQKSLFRLLQGRTSFVIAHRLSTITRADQILVLDHGHMIQEGKHAELLGQPGNYRQLYRNFAQNN